MRKNKLKKIFSEGKAAINGWLSIPNSFSAETMAQENWDSLTIDMQHGAIDYPNALQMLQAISTTDITPLTRVNWNEPGQIMKILDAGSYGIICPMVSSREQAEKFVQAALEENIIKPSSFLYPKKEVTFKSFSEIIYALKDVQTVVSMRLDEESGFELSKDEIASSLLPVEEFLENTTTELSSYPVA